MAPLDRIPKLSLYEALLFVVMSSMIVHLIYKRYEVQPSSYLLTAFLLLCTPAVSSTFLIPQYSSVLLAYLTGFSLFYSSLASSIVTYRLGPWHPLARYPGPKLARISKWWTVYLVRSGSHHRVMKELHDQYGDWVRVGPNEISVTDMSAIPGILGQDGMPRGPMWDGRRNPDLPTHVLSTRFVHDHAEKRKFWSRAFNTSAVKDYGDTISKRAAQLADEIQRSTTEQNGGKAVELQKWFSYFAFDFMGDMAFGGGFELMRDGDVRGIWKHLEVRVSDMAWQHHLPWATRLMLKIPAVSSSIVNFRKFTYECAQQRVENGSTMKDLFYHLGNEDGKRTSPPLGDLVAEGEVAIVAGSDTTATTLSGVFYYLLTETNLRSYRKLQEEIDDAFPPGVDGGEVFDHGKLGELPYLNAVINEALRLQPPVPTMLQRAPEKGSGGKWLGSRFIPEGTAVDVPIYVVQRDPRNFAPATEKFWPERWLSSTSSSEPEKFNGTPEKVTIIHNLTAYIPFSWGPAHCAGKNLALAEMRAVIAVLMHRFEMRLQDGFDAKKDFEGQLKDVFLFQVGRLPVVVHSRS